VSETSFYSPLLVRVSYNPIQILWTFMVPRTSHIVIVHRPTHSKPISDPPAPKQRASEFQSASHHPTAPIALSNGNSPPHPCTCWWLAPSALINSLRARCGDVDSAGTLCGRAELGYAGEGQGSEQMDASSSGCADAGGLGGASAGARNRELRSCCKCCGREKAERARIRALRCSSVRRKCISIYGIKKRKKERGK